MGNLSGWDADSEWQEFVRKPRGGAFSGPRDWVAPDDDTVFDSRDLPVSVLQPEAGFPRAAFFLWGVCACAIVVCVLGFFGVVAMPSAVWIVCALVACGCAAGAVVLHAPCERDWDDDGARV
ncbi:Uncharacterised protein [Arcanobacterium haemolyticum]|uniref:hypothetical protein n=1 Tax=Arcanobacterium haemolyticum TaxID=28264 RepID=UPI000D8F85DF|nr:hypothetical protein [Arcanobacterium haemolyticum]SPT75441.1 Uncharacterised protein [Arcanobacterium haemolyticum]